LKIIYFYIAYLVTTRRLLDWNIMINSKEKSNEIPNEINTDGGTIKETDAAGREKFWEDIGRP